MVGETEKEIQRGTEKERIVRAVHAENNPG
jgi:hypothetical protein